MSRDSHPIKLEDRHSGELIDATIFDGISEENLLEYRDIWVPQLNEAVARAKELIRQGKHAENPAEDGHWDWTGKVLKTRDSLSHKHFAIECEGKTQGLMQLQLSMRRSRIKAHQHLVYIDYLSVAPWNRKIIDPKPRFKLIGTMLIVQAIGTSIEEGFEGRIGLHALPRAAHWYRQTLKMTSFGRDDDYYGLEYFELSQEEAQAYIGKMNE